MVRYNCEKKIVIDMEKKTLKNKNFGKRCWEKKSWTKKF